MICIISKQIKYIRLLYKQKIQNEDFYLDIKKKNHRIALGLFYIKKFFNIILKDFQIKAVFNLEYFFLEAPTGSGKSLIILLFLIEKLLSGEKFYFISFDEYLVERDFNLFNLIFLELNKKNIYINDKTELTYDFNFQNYDCIFLTINSFSNLYFSCKRLVNQISISFFNSLKNILIDELDGIIWDLNRIPFVISKSETISNLNNIEYNFTKFFNLSKKIIKFNINNKLFYICKKEKKIKFTFMLSKILKLSSFEIICIKNMIEAQIFYKTNEDFYLDKNKKKILYLDSNTGKINENIMFSGLIHHFLCWYNNFPIQSYINTIIDFVDITSLIKLFINIYGLSATLLPIQHFLLDKFNKKVKVYEYIKSNLIKTTFYCLNEKVKLNLLIKIFNKEIIPILIIFPNIFLAEKYYNFFLNILKFKERILLFHGGLSQQHIFIEAIGEKFKILFTTNVFTRGVDIKLGSNKIIKDLLNTASDDNIKNILETILLEEKNFIIKRGGLLVILWEKFNDERINKQAEGRTARNELPGKVYYLTSFSDNQLLLRQKEYSESVINNLEINEKKTKELNIFSFFFRNKLLQIKKNINMFVIKFDNFCSKFLQKKEINNLFNKDLNKMLLLEIEKFLQNFI